MLLLYIFDIIQKRVIFAYWSCFGLVSIVISSCKLLKQTDESCGHKWPKILLNV